MLIDCLLWLLYFGSFIMRPAHMVRISGLSYNEVSLFSMIFIKNVL
jgi:hypothetical protein